MAIDPVCEMEVKESPESEKVLYEGETYHFCSTLCRVLFEEDPEKYLQKHNSKIDNGTE